MKHRSISTLLLSATLSLSSMVSASKANVEKSPHLKKLEELRTYLKTEKPKYLKRRTRKKAIISELDTINAEQNEVRNHIASMEMGYTELTMAFDNLRIEFDNQKAKEAEARKKLETLLKVFYRIKRDGLLRFVIGGGNFSEFASRARLLFRTLKRNSELTSHLAKQAKALAESEKQIAQAREDSRQLLGALEQQEKLLAKLLKKKKNILRKISKKQSYFLKARKEHKKVSKRVTKLFENFEKMRSMRPSTPIITPKKLGLPVNGGNIVRQFGKEVHKKFKTVTHYKGIEIEVAHKSQVLAVLDGKVEFEGWLKGLGNVLILHHGNGLYSLNAHLYQSIAHNGAEVKQGEPIALVGDTGNNTKPSLYFELRKDGKAVDPVPHFKAKSLKNLS